MNMEKAGCGIESPMPCSTYKVSARGHPMLELLMIKDRAKPRKRTSWISVREQTSLAIHVFRNVERESIKSAVEVEISFYSSAQFCFITSSKLRIFF
jgi:hypothetical protein